MQSISPSNERHETASGWRARVAHLFRRHRHPEAGEAEAPVAQLSHDVPDPVEWEESLIGIEPNTGEVDPPTIC
jgi:hypothetical protein